MTAVVTAVVGSVALDTEFCHHRLGTRASDHSHDELAHLIWDEECRSDPALPAPIGFHIAGVTSATQNTGPPMRGEGVPLILAATGETARLGPVSPVARSGCLDRGRDVGRSAMKVCWWPRPGSHRWPRVRG